MRIALMEMVAQSGFGRDDESHGVHEIWFIPSSQVENSLG